ncbi:unnamed protein product, partial [Ectocarpus fasciculatus]
VRGNRSSRLILYQKETQIDRSCNAINRSRSRDSTYGQRCYFHCLSYDVTTIDVVTAVVVFAKREVCVQSPSSLFFKGKATNYRDDGLYPDKQESKQKDGALLSSL